MLLTTFGTQLMCQIKAQEFMVILCPSGLLCLELEHGSCLKETSVKKGQCQLRVKVFESCESSFLLVILLSE